jgi:hypothetical protein
VGKSKTFEYMKEKLAKFVYEGIVMCVEISFQMVSNNGPQFTTNVIKNFMKKLSIKHSVTTTYKPITNELVECMNKVLCNLLNKEKEICRNLDNWDKKLHHAM